METAARKRGSTCLGAVDVARRDRRGLGPGALDQFLEKIPQGWPYGVEIRNRHFLHPDYFAVLAKHNVAHVYNSWADMPPVGEQMAMAGSLTNPRLCGARFLLKPGRKYQDAVDLFSPYDRVKDPNPEARAAGAKLITDGVAAGLERRKTFIYVNNRLEGNALATIQAMVEPMTTINGWPRHF
jgi:Protein of unknown function DUF72